MGELATYNFFFQLGMREFNGWKKFKIRKTDFKLI
jgi:hypothetical protein